MKSLKELYKIGRGPSSSHTIGPQRIAEYTLKKFGRRRYKVVLFGSLSLTGRGHGTDRVLREVLGGDTEIVFDTVTKDIPHPNYLKIYSLDGKETEELVSAESVGGGSVTVNGENIFDSDEIYPEKDFASVESFCLGNGLTLPGYVKHYEPDIFPYLHSIWGAMKESVERGLERSGTLPGGLMLERKARALYLEEAHGEPSLIHENRLVSAYALAVAEENADNGIVVTAPTCGASGVLPAVLYYMYKDCGIGEDKILDAIAVAGVIGNTVKQNASISGAECGCEAEIGVA